LRERSGGSGRDQGSRDTEICGERIEDPASVGTASAGGGAKKCSMEEAVVDGSS